MVPIIYMIFLYDFTFSTVVQFIDLVLLTFYFLDSDSHYTVGSSYTVSDKRSTASLHVYQLKRFGERVSVY